MNELLLILLLGFLAWLVWICVGDLRVELAALTTCDHCGGSRSCGCSHCRGVCTCCAE